MAELQPDGPTVGMGVVEAREDLRSRTTFGAVFPSVVFWPENIADFSAIGTGLAIVPGPPMAPIFAVVGQRLVLRIPVGVLVALGNLLFRAGAVLLAVSAPTDVQDATRSCRGGSSSTSVSAWPCPT
ncbi:hypothetical protein [Nonomuraea sp. NPDC003804]|uniref:hypothetical protein n=1 Tax=Nonomuraea sp. NPDC003804 TaxID=3154547 RepID=UPI0033A05B12